MYALSEWLKSLKERCIKLVSVTISVASSNVKFSFITQGTSVIPTFLQASTRLCPLNIIYSLSFSHTIIGTSTPYSFTLSTIFSNLSPVYNLNL